MIIHIDTQRGDRPQHWIAIQTTILGFALTETIIDIENQKDRMLAVITNIGHAARQIEINGYLRHNKILIQDDRDLATGNHEQFEIFEMLSERRKKLLLALGGDYAKYLSAVIALIRYWQIAIGLTSDRNCDNCAMSLEVYEPKCGACGQRHEVKWK